MCAVPGSSCAAPTVWSSIEERALEPPIPTQERASTAVDASTDAALEANT
jgi:hypothetical protein